MKEKIRGLLSRVLDYSVRISIAIPVKRLLFFLLLVALVAITVLWIRTVLLSEIPLIFRDLTIASVAHIKAGDPVPFEADVVSYILDPKETWQVRTNSHYLVEWAAVIVPFYEYESITAKADYPTEALFVPQHGGQSFHLLGQAACNPNVVRYNLRITQDDRYRDERLMLSTMVHEMIHIQDGNFCNETVQEREAHTQAATLEVLAAMCNYSDDLACAAFWKDLEGFARDSLYTRMRHFFGTSSVYDAIANFLWRDSSKEAAVRKAMRYWASDPVELYRIIEDYGYYPWNKYVIPGVQGRYMNTGNKAAIPAQPWKSVVIGTPFDDTIDLLGILRVLFYID